MSGRVFCDNFLGYESARFITIRNWKLAITFRALQLGVVAYIIVFQIFIKQGYQEYDTFIGTTSTKVKGAASVGTFGTSNFQVYDVYDLVPNPVEKDALFMTTNLIPTVGQTRSTCAGNDGSEFCNATLPCVPGTPTMNGVISDTTCHPSKVNGTSGYCTVHTWCPFEPNIKNPTQYLMSNNIAKWTIYLKVNGNFPKFDLTMSNTFNTSAKNNGLVPLINLFSIEQILSGADTTYEKIAQFGTIILASATYDCDLNKGDDCDPKFDFTRLDTDSPGFNYRYIVTGPASATRDLIKVYGIRMLMNVHGIAGRFSPVPLLIAIGSGVGLLSVATLVCDFVLQKFLPDKDRYLAEKYQFVAETGIPEFSANDVLAVNELANTRHMDIPPNNEQVVPGVNSPYRLMNGNAR